MLRVLRRDNKIRVELKEGKYVEIIKNSKICGVELF